MCICCNRLYICKKKKVEEIVSGDLFPSKLKVSILVFILKLIVEIANFLSLE